MSTNTSHTVATLEGHPAAMPALPVEPFPQPGLIEREDWQAAVRVDNGAINEQISTRTILDALATGQAALGAQAWVNAAKQGDAVTGGLPRLTRLEYWEKGIALLSEIKGLKFLGKVGVVAAGIVLRTPKAVRALARQDMHEELASFESIWRPLEARIGAGLEAGIAAGYIPDGVRQRLAPAFSQTKVELSDSHLLAAELGPGTAEYTSGDVVRVSHSEGENTDKLEHKLVHEMIHKLSGGTFLRDAVGLVLRTRGGIANVGAFVGNKLRASRKFRVMEAVNEHVTQAVLRGDFATIDPDQRPGVPMELSKYNNYRRIVAAYVARSEGIVEVKAFTRSHFEETTAKGGFAERRRLVQQSKQAYGSGNPLKKLEMLCSLVPCIGDAPKELMAAVLSRIHSPRVLEDGKVEAGTIDVTDIPEFAILVSH